VDQSILHDGSDEDVEKKKNYGIPHIDHMFLEFMNRDEKYAVKSNVLMSDQMRIGLLMQNLFSKKIVKHKVTTRKTSMHEK
jgi:hypothetical protein